MAERCKQNYLLCVKVQLYFSHSKVSVESTEATTCKYYYKVQKQARNSLEVFESDHVGNQMVEELKLRDSRLELNIKWKKFPILK